MYDVHAMNDARNDWQNIHRRIMDFKSRKNVSTRETIRELMHKDMPKLRELGLYGGFIYEDGKDSMIIKWPMNEEYKDALNRYDTLSVEGLHYIMYR